MNYLFVFLIALIACFPIIPAIKKRIEQSSQAVYSIAAVTATCCALMLLFVDTSVLVETFGSNNPFIYWNF
jgi:hypothetical protein